MEVLRNTCFWTLISNSNRGEYILQLQDGRMLKMFNNRTIYILSFYERCFFRLNHKFKIELHIEKNVVEKKLQDLDSLKMKTVYIQTNNKKNIRWNPALVYPFTALIQSSFSALQQPIKIVFSNNQEKEHFLNVLNAATRKFVTENIEFWNEVNT